MAQQPLQGWQGDTSLDGRDAKRMPQHMRRHRPADAHAVGHVLDEELEAAHAEAQGVMQRKVPFNERLDAVGQRNDAALGPATVRPALAVDGEPVPLPVDMVFRETCQLGDAQAGVKERPDHELLQVRRAGVGQAVGFLRGQRFAFVLVGHGGLPRMRVSAVRFAKCKGSRIFCAINYFVQMVTALIYKALLIHDTVREGGAIRFFIRRRQGRRGRIDLPESCPVTCSCGYYFLLPQDDCAASETIASFWAWVMRPSATKLFAA